MFDWQPGWLWHHMILLSALTLTVFCLLPVQKPMVWTHPLARHSATAIAPVWTACQLNAKMPNIPPYPTIWCKVYALQPPWTLLGASSTGTCWRTPRMRAEDQQKGKPFSIFFFSPSPRFQRNPWTLSLSQVLERQVTDDRLIDQYVPLVSSIVFSWFSYGRFLKLNVFPHRDIEVLGCLGRCWNLQLRCFATPPLRSTCVWYVSQTWLPNSLSR